MLFLSGVFAHLEMLEARAHEAAVKQAAAEQRKEQLARLEARVQALRQRRDELQAKVELQEQGVRKGSRRDLAQRGLWCTPPLRTWIY